MKRRSVNARSIAIGLFLLVIGIGLFTELLMPLEVWLVDGLGKIFLGYHAIRQGDSNLVRPPSNEIRVIAKRSDEFQSTFTVNRALSQGTRIISNGNLIGIVSLEGNSSSKVEAIVSPLFHTPGVFVNTGIPAEFEGKGAILLETKVPRGSQVSAGDVVLYADDPRIVLGSVVEIIDMPSEPFLIIVVQSPINLTTLSVVEAL